MKISIIIPVYNRAYCLARCLDSVRNQTYSDWECIVVDDGSTDGTWVVCETYAAMDRRFAVCRQENAGVSAARNKGLDIAAGRYVTFLDSDDCLDLAFLEKMLQRVCEKEFVLCALYEEHPVMSYYSDLETVALKTGHEGDVLELIEAGLLYGPVAKLFDREVLEQYHIRFPLGISYGEDTIFNFTYLKYMDKIHVLPERLYIVINTPNSLSYNITNNSPLIYLKRFEAICLFFQEKNMYEKASGYLDYFFLNAVWCSLCLIYLARGKFSSGERYLLVKSSIDYARKLPYNGSRTGFSIWRYVLLKYPFLFWLLQEIRYIK